MLSAQEIIEKAIDLPVEEQLTVVDALLKSLDVPDPKIDRAWLDTAKRRAEELRSGRVQGVPGEEVMEKVRKILEK
jgi:putative addiction module component (TIGR02574 family)